MSRITKDHFSFVCPMNWDEMTPSENGRFCARCSKEVFNLTDCSLDQARALQRKHGRICGMVKTTVLAASLSLAACKPHVTAGVICLPEEEQPGAEDVQKEQESAPEKDSGEAASESGSTD